MEQISKIFFQKHLNLLNRQIVSKFHKDNNNNKDNILHNNNYNIENNNNNIKNNNNNKYIYNNNNKIKFKKINNN